MEIYRCVQWNAIGPTDTRGLVVGQLISHVTGARERADAVLTSAVPAITAVQALIAICGN